MRRLRQASNLLLYLLIPGLGAATPLLVYPALTAQYGSTGFAAVAVAQSLGLAGATICELGWSVLGPQRVARAQTAERASLYQSALATKLLATLVGAPVAAVAAAVIATDYKPAAAVLAAASVATCLSPGWFLVGANRPLAILAFEGIPRLLIMAGVAGLLLAGAPLLVYGIGTLVAVIFTQVAVALRFGQRVLPRLSAFTSGGAIIKQQLPLTGGRAVSVVYTSLPIAIVGLVNPSAVAVFAAVDRLMRMALAILGGVPSRLQSWVGSAPENGRVKRSRQSLLMNAALGAISGVGFAVLVPFVANLVFSGTIDIVWQVAVLGGAILFAICASRGFGLSLVAEGRANWIALANILAAIAGVATTFALTGPLGAPGAQLGGLCAELVGIAVQAFCLFLLKRPPRDAHLG